MTDKVATSWSYPYSPFDKQLQFHAAYDVDEVLFGGAGGPGKTDAVLAAGVTQCLAVPNSKALLLRRSYGELEDEIIPRLQQRIPRWVAKYNSGTKAFRFANGSVLRLGYLERDDDMYQYIGAEYQLIIWDELTQQQRKPYSYLRTRLRMAGQVAKDMDAIGWKPRYIATTNPAVAGTGG